MRNIKILLLSFAMLFAFGFVLAQETTDVTEEINLDEDVQAEDFEIQEPKLLPDSPFYFFKAWGREIRAVFAFDPVKKAELRERFANEKLLELKKMVEEKKSAAVINRAAENYQNEARKIEMATEKIREKAEENAEVGKFLDKYTQHQVLHQWVLQKLENQVPAEAFEKIKEARENHLEKFGEVMTRLETKEKIQERLEKNLQEVEGSEFKEFKNLEMLKELSEKVPEQAKEAIQKARENSLERLREKVEEMPAEKVEQFKLYIERIAGEKEEQMEILDNLKEELKAKPVIQEKLKEVREKILENIQERSIEMNCPEIEKPASNFCQDDRIVVRKNEAGCIIGFSCIKPVQTSGACITLWDPVCGKNGKTYSNSCFAKLAGIETAYEGQCKKTECKVDADCLQSRCIGVQSKCIDGECIIPRCLQSTPEKMEAEEPAEEESGEAETMELSQPEIKPMNFLQKNILEPIKSIIPTPKMEVNR